MEVTLLYIQQEKWQKELTTVTSMDATYKMTKYSIPLFFACVKTNVSYSVVAEFSFQSETTDSIYAHFEVVEPKIGASILHHRLL